MSDFQLTERQKNILGEALVKGAHAARTHIEGQRVNHACALNALMDAGVEDGNPAVVSEQERESEARLLREVVTALIDNLNADIRRGEKPVLDQIALIDRSLLWNSLAKLNGQFLAGQSS